MDQDESPRGAEQKAPFRWKHDKPECTVCGRVGRQIDKCLECDWRADGTNINAPPEATTAPQSNVASDDDNVISHTLLHIAPSALAPDLDYQWFASDGPPPLRRDLPQDGWVPVRRDYMPDEPSDDAEFIQRREMHLFTRLKTLSDAVRRAQFEQANRAITFPRAYGLGAGVSDRPLRQPHPRAGSSATTPLWRPTKAKSGRYRPSRSGQYHGRGRVLVVFEESLHRRLVPVVAALWQILAAGRVLYMTRNEREMAERQGTDYADWAWAKIDLLREGYLWKPYRFSVQWGKRRKR